MKVNGKEALIIKPFITIGQLSPGDCFRIIDETDIYMVTDTDCPVNIETGEIVNFYDRWQEGAPIEKIDAYLNVAAKEES